MTDEEKKKRITQLLKEDALKICRVPKGQITVSSIGGAYKHLSISLSQKEWQHFSHLWGNLWVITISAYYVDMDGFVLYKDVEGYLDVFVKNVPKVR